MILDGDILAYFDEMGIDVEESTYEDTFSFIFKISYGSFDLDASFTIHRSMNLLSFMVVMENPEVIESMPLALNALNANSTILKAYYDRLDDAVFINVITCIDYILTSIKDLDYEYIENLYNSIYKEDYDASFDLEFEKAHQDTSIEEDMAELMSLLRKKR